MLLLNSKFLVTLQKRKLKIVFLVWHNETVMMTGQFLCLLHGKKLFLRNKRLSI